MKKIESTIEAWENRELGADEKYVAVSSSVDELKLDECLGLKQISIRMDQSLIDTLKFLGETHGLGYQTLMKNVLRRFADAEMKKLVREQRAAQGHKMSEDDKDEYVAYPALRCN